MCLEQLTNNSKTSNLVCRFCFSRPQKAKVWTSVNCRFLFNLPQIGELATPTILKPRYVPQYLVNKLLVPDVQTPGIEAEIKENIHYKFLQGSISPNFVGQAKSCWHIALGEDLTFSFTNILSIWNCAEFCLH